VIFKDMTFIRNRMDAASIKSLTAPD